MHQHMYINVKSPPSMLKIVEHWLARMNLKRVWRSLSFGFRVDGLRLEVSGCRVLGFKLSGFGFQARVQDLGLLQGAPNRGDRDGTSTVHIDRASFFCNSQVLKPMTYRSLRDPFSRAGGPKWIPALRGSQPSAVDSGASRGGMKVLLRTPFIRTLIYDFNWIQDPRGCVA